MVGPTTQFCTILDAAYVPRWLALYRSMTRYDRGTRFLVCCWDARARSLINGLGLSGVTTVRMGQLEAYDPQLAAVRSERDFRAYRAGSKPTLLRYIFEHDRGVEIAAYLDADLMFFADPGALIEELDGHSVLLVPQRHPPDRGEYDEIFGAYQAGTLAFRRGADADEALAWWRARCLEWCSLEPEPGRWGDQRYLQDWPERFGGVHVTEHAGMGVAPWNAAQHRFLRRAGRTLVDDQPLIFYHYSSLFLSHGASPWLRLLSLVPGAHLCGGPAPLGWGHPYYRPGTAERRLVWEPYVSAVSAALAATRELDHGYGAGLASPWVHFREMVLRRRVLWAGLWALRILFDRGRVATARLGDRLPALEAAAATATSRLTRWVGTVDRWRKRWRVE